VNLANGKHLHVRINDRGPYVNSRILDLSRGAAARLGMVEGGLSVVRVQLVGEYWPAALLSSEALETVSVALILGREQAPSGTTEPHQLGKSRILCWSIPFDSLLAISGFSNARDV
jgi:rare lipoprotein A (peptidoglycan hydrolase)